MVVDGTTEPLLMNEYCAAALMECSPCAFCHYLQDGVGGVCPDACGEVPDGPPAPDTDGTIDPADPDAEEEEEPPVDGEDAGEADGGEDPDPADEVPPDDSCVVLGCPAPTSECVDPGVCDSGTGTCSDFTATAAGTPCAGGVCDGLGLCVTAVDPDPVGCGDTGCPPTADPTDTCRVQGECLGSGQCTAETVLSPGTACTSGAVPSGGACSDQGVCVRPFTCAKMCADGACTGDRPEPWDEREGVKLFTEEDGCTACRDNRILLNGKCLTSYQCFKRQSQYGPSEGDSCRCAAHCHDCIISSDGAGGSAEVCKQCRDGWFLKDGVCIEQCPAGDTQLGTQNSFKRRCLEPFLCKSSAIYEGTFPTDFTRRIDPSTDEPLQLGCRCTRNGGAEWDKQCLACDFVAGGVGDRCIRCRGGHFLVRSDGPEAQCEASCPAGMAEYAPIGQTYGKECRDGFTCTAGIDDVDGSPCSCRQFGRSCTACRISATDPACTSA